MKTPIIHQFIGKSTYNGERIYIDKALLTQAGFIPGTRFRTVTSTENNKIEFTVDHEGANKVSKKVRNQNSIPVIDKTGIDIKGALKDCAHIKVTFVEGRVIIEGLKNTATILKENKHCTSDGELKTISFCAGTGISSQCLIEAGFKEIASVEWNPKEGSEHKFSDIYVRNHPESIMFNLPMQLLDPNDLPYADVWVATLDCTDFSKASNGTKKEFQTMHLFMHLMRLFWGKEQSERPVSILFENVGEFEKVAGVSLELCLKEEGFSVTRTKIDSLDYGSRTKRERFFMVASIFEGFCFPEPTGRNKNSIEEDGVLSIDELEWITPDESDTLKYFLTREDKGITHNHYMTMFDISKDAYVGTITKSHHKIQPENWIKHPTIPNNFAYLKGNHIRALHGISEDYYLGDSNKLVVESIGQSVCLQTFKAIAQRLYKFLLKNLNSLMKRDQENIHTNNHFHKNLITDDIFTIEDSGQLAML
ncbi:DNA cytosine methyltransferase [Paenibacillus glucanolyticus]|uniref:DNA (cytosine-5-)-methyltransferase n=1 Tax=Paenibacillus glucanolyticus TaxID=59843 RepID=A0A163GGX8_9BACL|nr:DNA cytosine methyltransferase [Paenibacillus glucanolyticus]KZS44966.1 hypothetical protein AWU65_03020 [Paenibacillus glucanolyticus]OMF64826.1 hypothetical protein BK142_31365 [Paenibacillus glucanolyticus]